jgi:hypothetical protein
MNLCQPTLRNRSHFSRKFWGHVFFRSQHGRLRHDDGRWCSGRRYCAAERADARAGDTVAGLLRGGRLRRSVRKGDFDRRYRHCPADGHPARTILTFEGSAGGRIRSNDSEYRLLAGRLVRGTLAARAIPGDRSSPGILFKKFSGRYTSDFRDISRDGSDLASGHTGGVLRSRLSQLSNTLLPRPSRILAVIDLKSIFLLEPMVSIL